MIMYFTRKAERFFILAVISGLLLTACSRDKESGGTPPVKLALLLDQAKVSGAGAQATERSPEEKWRVVFREDFEGEGWRQWVPSPNQVAPPPDAAAETERWRTAVESLRRATSTVPGQGKQKGSRALQITGSFDLQWLGYTLPVPVHGGRRYRLSASIRTRGWRCSIPRRRLSSV